MSELSQTTNTVLMVRPGKFGFNAETAISNNYQSKLDLSSDEVQIKASTEFDGFVEMLRDVGVDVMVFQSPETPVTPDAVFPNNWIRIAHNGRLDLFPMLAENRRLERNPQLVKELQEKYAITSVDKSLLSHENNSKFLEGTGSIVFDHPRKRAYACISPRTNKELFDSYCKSIGYEAISFEAKRDDGQLQYHTNVVLAIGSRFALGDFDRFGSEDQKQHVMNTLSENLELISLTADQVEKGFCGNAIELKNSKDEAVWVMSITAWRALTAKQQEQLSSNAHIVKAPLDVIEKVGGGSARCMVCEVFTAQS